MVERDTHEWYLNLRVREHDHEYDGVRKMRPAKSGFGILHNNDDHLGTIINSNPEVKYDRGSASQSCLQLESVRSGITSVNFLNSLKRKKSLDVAGEDITDKLLKKTQSA